MAHTRDQVTGGRNCLGLQERFGELVQRQGPCLAVVVLNLKGFRYLNLRYGRSAGDDILRMVGQGLDQLLQPGESWGRMAADQFCLLLQGGGQAEVEARIVTLDWALYDLPDPRINRLLCFSYGIYLVEGEAPDFYTALERADLCRVKSQHYPVRNSSYEFYRSEFAEQFLEENEVILCAVKELREHAFQAYVQPKVRLTDEKIVGGEVLMRWPDGLGGMRPLPEFLPIFERSGFIRNVDLDLFGQVCAAYDRLLQAGKSPVPISFNVSRSCFEDPKFLEDYLDQLRIYPHVPHHLIEFELLESIAMDESERLLDVVNQIKQAGFCCSLDDFGSGYSSFRVLMNIEIDTLKLDGAFFRNPLTEKERGVLRTILDLAQHLHYVTVAEGVERAEDVDFLRSLGCDIIQGFYFYRPMPLEDFIALTTS